jgi:tetratricopeptide (TPR) repeat protein
VAVEEMVRAHGLVKDPLQAEQTPYEFLGVGHEATEEEIDEAFQSGFVNGLDHQDLLNSKRVLQDPVERALVDAFHYWPETTQCLKPDVASNTAALEGSRRWETAQAWQAQFKAGFPDAQIAHCLGIFWFWWAMSADDGRNGSKLPLDPPEMWRRASGCWAMALADPRFWKRMGTGVADKDRVVQEILGTMAENLRKRAQRYRAQGNTALASEYQQLEHALAAEIGTAQTMAANGLRFNDKPIGCGLLLLEELDLREDVRGVVVLQLKRKPGDDQLRKLRDALSEFAPIVELLAANSPQAALDRIEGLQWSKMHEPECVELRAKALHALGKQQAAAGRITDALELWQKALDTGASEDVKRKIREDAVSACHSKAIALRANQTQAAVDLLELGIVVTDDGRLKLLLGELLLSRGIKTFTEAQESARPGQDTAEIKRKMQQGLADLERAAVLGSARAAEQRDAARSILASLEIDVPMTQAMAAIRVQDWDSAIRYLRQALGLVPNLEVVKQNLSHCLSQRAVHRVNEAVKNASAESERRKSELVDKLTNRIDLNSCAQCGKYMGPSASMPMCSNCMPEALRLLGGEGSDREVLAAIERSEQDLREAIQLDPTNAAVRKNQDDLAQLRQQIEQGHQVVSGQSATAPGSSPFGRSGPAPRSRVRPRTSEPSTASRYLSAAFKVFAYTGLFWLLALAGYLLEPGDQWTLSEKGAVALLGVITVVSVITLARKKS